MKKIFSILVLSCCFIALSARSYTVDEIPNVHVADRTRFLSNPDGIISPEAQSAVDSTLSRIRRTTSAEVVAVVVDDIDGDDVDIFANELFDEWGLGKKDNNNGVLLLVAVDSRKAVIRTGPGVEGILTDATCGRILRNEMFPEFRRGNYDAGVVAAVAAISERLGDPEAAAEVMSSLPDNDNSDGDGENFLSGYLGFSFLLTLFVALAFIIKLISLRGKSPYDKFTAFENWRPVMLILSFAGLGVPLLVTLPLLLMMRHWRNSTRKCPNCGHNMIKIDEVHDNDYLTPAQDCEERIGSVDYDVWHCPTCGETDIFPFVNKALPLTECSNCHARTAKLTGDRILVQPTTTRQGVGAKEFTCLNCHHKTMKRYNIAKLAPVIIVPGGGGGRGNGFGGGSIGGGFGGGFTGGGGASGGW